MLSRDLSVDEVMQLLRTLGGRIALKRHEHQITQQSLANNLGVHQTLVSHWERNVIRPNRDHIDPLVAALHTTREWLLTNPLETQAA